MHKTILVLTAALAMAGCSTTRDRDVVVSSSSTAVLMSPQPVVRQAPMRMASGSQASLEPSAALLKPGPGYVASFPEADRRAACQRLDYREGTRAFAACMIGDFPENPYFEQARN
ncbi:hypothetical protein [Devosia naphthalenivorans]|uniref:hypothetical protein n=1 Tax=Devosia naphthalenivorans TaxID=2082392 RepID=UPI000D39A4F8|nr:hypothetical protein [Devosia naphthalenivorans]